MTKSQNTYDLIVVGYGIAGISAALEALDAGLKVLVLDRGYGGGASALSGGVVYAGGGTKQQKEAGFEDSPENMYNYLILEVDGVVSDETVRRFCQESPGMITWLEGQGAEFMGSFCNYKTSYPNDPFYLYFSGNEGAWPYTEKAEPAPRGHRQVAKGMSSGNVLFHRLKATAEKKGVIFKPLSHVDELIMEDKKVVGVKYRYMPEEKSDQHSKLTNRGSKLSNWFPPLGNRYMKKADQIWEETAVTAAAYGKGVILSAGGFVFNPEMKAKYEQGAFKHISPLGTVGDDGKGIKLGVSAGGQTNYMERMTAWRFLSPPSAWLEGVSVGRSGKRVANEDLYGATFSNYLIKEHDGVGYLVMDSAIWKKAKSLVKEQSLTFQRLQALYITSPIGHKKAGTIEALAEKIGVNPDGLKETIRAYNKGIKSGEGDPAKKHPDMCTPIEEGPFYAIDISIENSFAFPAPGLTLGGLIVDEETGQVLNEEDQPIKGLYAAGRNAVGICSNSYISGLSLADGVFSGRRAARHIIKTVK